METSDRDGGFGVDVVDGGLEDWFAFGAALAAGGEGVVHGFRDAFGVGHEAEDSAGGVGDSGDGFDGAVGELGVGGGAVAVLVDVFEGDLVVGAEGLEDFGVFGDEAAFA